MNKIIIYTDLDGTLIDENYSFEAALPALLLLSENNIPLILCSSKTRNEIEYYRGFLDNNDPFISENGGGIFIPKGYFDLRDQTLDFKLSVENEYHMINIGARYEDLRSTLEELRADGFDIKGFGDMSVEEVAGLTGLTIGEAEMAKARDFDEPFIYYGDKDHSKKLFDAITSRGFNVTKGRFNHILGNSDKGRAISILNNFYIDKFDNIFTVAIGDSPNDIPMLQCVDLPVIVKKSGGEFDPSINVKGLVKVPGIGPEGWNMFVQNFILSQFAGP